MQHVSRALRDELHALIDQLPDETESVVVRVSRTIKHPLYKRYVRRSARFMAQSSCSRRYGQLRN